MDRRGALKGMGLSLGYLVATPTVISMLASCTNQSDMKWVPIFFSKDEASLLDKLIDLILPASDNVPGAIDVGVPQFLDMFYDHVVEIQERNSFIKGLQLIRQELGDKVNDIELKQYDFILAKYLKANTKETERFQNNEKDKLIYQTLFRLRKYAVWAFKTSEKIGKEILPYDPIPGIYKGCMPLEEATGGKKWSLMD